MHLYKSDLLLAILVSFSLFFPGIVDAEEDVFNVLPVNTYFKNFTSISCDEKGQHCVAVSEFMSDVEHKVYITENGGLTWSEEIAFDQHPPHTSAMKIQCDNMGMNCLMSGFDNSTIEPSLLIYASHDGGYHWNIAKKLPCPHNASPLTDSLPILHCDASGRQCIVGFSLDHQNRHIPLIYTTQNAGESWSDPFFLALLDDDQGGVDLSSISCDITGHSCVILGESVYNYNLIRTTSLSYYPHTLTYFTQDGGATWSLPESLNISTEHNDDMLQKIDCDQSGLRCLAVGYHPRENDLMPINFSYRTQDGGHTWTDPVDLDPLVHDLDGALTALHCDDAVSRCVAVGFSEAQNEEHTFAIIYRTTDAGKSWQKESFESRATSTVLFDLFCTPHAELCHAIGFESPST